MDKGINVKEKEIVQRKEGETEIKIDEKEGGKKTGEREREHVMLMNSLSRWKRVLIKLHSFLGYGGGHMDYKILRLLNI